MFKGQICLVQSGLVVGLTEFHLLNHTLPQSVSVNIPFQTLQAWVVLWQCSPRLVAECKYNNYTITQIQYLYINTQYLLPYKVALDSSQHHHLFPREFPSHNYNEQLSVNRDMVQDVNHMTFLSLIIYKANFDLAHLVISLVLRLLVEGKGEPGIKCLHMCIIKIVLWLEYR